MCRDTGWIIGVNMSSHGWTTDMAERCPNCQKAFTARALYRLLCGPDNPTEQDIADADVNWLFDRPTVDRATFEQYQVGDYEERRRLLNAAKAFAKLATHEGRAPVWCLAFVGMHGVGKTHLAIAIAREWLAAGHEAAYINVEVWHSTNRLKIASERLGMGGTIEARTANSVEYDILNRLTTIKLLIVDEMPAAANGTAYQDGNLEALLILRHARRLPTVLCSNYLPRSWSPRLASRISEGEVVAVAGLPDYREEGA